MILTCVVYLCTFTRDIVFDIHFCSTLLNCGANAHSVLKRQTKTPLSKKKLQFDLEPVDELGTTSEVRPEVSPDLPHNCREKRKHEINTEINNCSFLNGFLSYMLIFAAGK
jgi:hypothetical protein